VKGRNVVFSWFCFIIFIFVIFIGACTKKSPTAPTPKEDLCQDRNASNVGQPLPCVFDLPTTSYVELVSVIPPAGSTLKKMIRGPGGYLDGGDMVYATLKWGVSKSDLDNAKQINGYIGAMACLSVDGIRAAGQLPGTTILNGACGKININGGFTNLPVGEGITGPGMSLIQDRDSDVNKTNFIIIEMYMVDPNKPANESIITLFRKAIPLVYYWN
jgi:hypothetical protein